MNKTFDIVVAGGGIVGLTVAALLVRCSQASRLRITIVDAGQRPEFLTDDDLSSRVSAISCGSADVMQQAGVWDAVVLHRHCPYRDMRVWDAAGSADGPDTLAFAAAEFALPQLGFIVENVLIQDVLLAELERGGVSLRYASSISSLRRSDDRFVLTLESGEDISAELLLAADGARSLIREQAGISVRSWRYPQRAFVTHLQPEHAHQNTAWQRFLPTGPIGLLPLHDGRVSTVWSTTPELAAEALAATDEQLESMLTEASGATLGRLKPAGARGAFPLHAQHTTQYVMPGLALLGDAAHAVHPLAGQGANLGISDAAMLARVVEDALSKNEHPGDVSTLRRYERARKGENETMLRFIDGLNRLFSNDSRALAHVRGAGMRLFNKSGQIRDYAVQVALGLR